METGLLVCERAILECFSGREELFLQDFNSKLELGEDVIFQILQVMVERNILTKLGSGYHKNEINLNRDAIREEIEDVLKSFLRIKKKKKQDNFHMGAYSMTPFEEKVFKFHMDNFKQFIESIQKKDKPQNLMNRKIIFFGHGDFQDVLHESLKLVD